MLAQLVKLFRPSSEQQEAYSLYAALVQQAREPRLYTTLGVPDTLDGRFELIVLHLFLIFERLQPDIGSGTFRQYLAEAFFDDMDRSLREMGVGDTGIGRRVQKMSEAFYGRMKNYAEALGNTAVLEDALRRNLYGTLSEDADPPLSVAAKYVFESLSLLKNQPIEEIHAANPHFPAL
ncbi:MAG: ubiquinol-cytochrome C chaperone family protein [Rickettsiales bacterium]